MRIGWIGVGNMGLPMAGNLLAAGREVAAFDVDESNLARLAARGAEAAPSIAGACDGAGLVFSSIPDDDALREVAFAEDGVLASAAAGAAWVEMSTVSPRVSAEVAAAARGRGVGYLRSPVSGSVRLAETARLTVLASGPEDVFDACRPLLERIGATVFRVGDGEEARYLKLALNNMVHATAVAFAESLALCRKGGLDWPRTLDVFAASAVASPLVQYKTEPLRARDFSPTSFVSTALKDQELFLEAARSAGVALDVAPALAGVFREMLDSEDAGRDFIATVLRTERRSGLGEP